MLPTGVKNPEASFALARYLSDEEFQKVQNKTGSGRLPTLKAVASDPYWNTVDPRVKQFVELLPFSHIRPADRADRHPQPRAGRRRRAPRRSSSRGRRPPAAPSADANQRVNDAIKEGRAD